MIDAPVSASTPASPPPSTPGSTAPSTRTWQQTAAPVVFVALWSTGFVAAHYATIDNGPFAFLTVRMALAAIGLGVAAVVTGAPWPRGRALTTSLLAGLGIHACYLGGVFMAISLGMPSGMSALISGLHPVGTALVSRVGFGERLRGTQWAGIALGFAGVAWFTADRLGDSNDQLAAGAVVAMAVSLAGMIGGTLIQQRSNVTTSLLSGTAVQYAATALVLGAVAVTVERRPINITSTFVWAQVWAVVVLSIGAVLLMFWLLRTRAASSVSSLFFLTPALSSIQAAVLFDEQLHGVAAASLAISAVGVVLVMRQRS